MGDQDLQAVGAKYDAEFDGVLGELRLAKSQLPTAAGSANGRVQLGHFGELQGKLRTTLRWAGQKLPAELYLPRLVEWGTRLQEISEHTAAAQCCFEPCIAALSGSTAKAGGEADVRAAAEADGEDEEEEEEEEETKAAGQQRTLSVTELQTKVSAMYGRALGAFAEARDADPYCRLPHTLAALLRAVADVRAGMALLLATPQAAHADVAWHVFNGSVHLYRCCEPLMTLGHAEHLVEYFVYGVVACEAVVNLSTTKYIPWRVRLYTACCHCYEDIAARAPGSAEDAAANAAREGAACEAGWAREAARHEAAEAAWRAGATSAPEWERELAAHFAARTAADATRARLARPAESGADARSRMMAAASAVAGRALAKLEELRRTEYLDPPRRQAKVALDALFEEARVALSTLRLKYETMRLAGAGEGAAATAGGLLALQPNGAEGGDDGAGAAPADAEAGPADGGEGGEAAPERSDLLQHLFTDDVQRLRAVLEALADPTRRSLAPRAAEPQRVADVALMQTATRLLARNPAPGSGRDAYEEAAADDGAALPLDVVVPLAEQFASRLHWGGAAADADADADAANAASADADAGAVDGVGAAAAAGAAPDPEGGAIASAGFDAAMAYAASSLAAVDNGAAPRPGADQEAEDVLRCEHGLLEALLATRREEVASRKQAEEEAAAAAAAAAESGDADGADAAAEQDEGDSAAAADGADADLAVTFAEGTKPAPPNPDGADAARRIAAPDAAHPTANVSFGAIRALASAVRRCCRGRTAVTAARRPELVRDASLLLHRRFVAPLLAELGAAPASEVDALPAAKGVELLRFRLANGWAEPEKTRKAAAAAAGTTKGDAAALAAAAAEAEAAAARAQRLAAVAATARVALSAVVLALRTTAADDALLCGTLSLRLGLLQDEAGEPRDALQTLRCALGEVEAARAERLSFAGQRPAEAADSAALARAAFTMEQALDVVAWGAGEGRLADLASGDKLKTSSTDTRGPVIAGDDGLAEARAAAFGGSGVGGGADVGTPSPTGVFGAVSALEPLDQALGCVHADLLSTMFRVELRMGAALARTVGAARDKAAAVARAAKEAAEAALAAAGGKKANKDDDKAGGAVNLVATRKAEKAAAAEKKRIDRERAEGVEHVDGATVATEARLRQELKNNGAARALLLVQLALMHGEAPKEQARLLAEAAAALRETAAAEDAFLPASAKAAAAAAAAAAGEPVEEKEAAPAEELSAAAQLKLASVPPVPQIVSRTPTSATVWPQPLPAAAGAAAARKGTPVASYRVFGKPAGAGTSVSLTSDELAGTGVDVPASDVENGAVGATVEISGLLPNEKYVFAVAAFDAAGNVLGAGIGVTSPPVVAALPLPLPLLWGELCSAAYQIAHEDCPENPNPRIRGGDPGAKRLALEAADMLLRKFTRNAGEGRPRWAVNPMYALALRPGEAARAPRPVLRALANALRVSACGAGPPSQDKAFALEGADSAIDNYDNDDDEDDPEGGDPLDRPWVATQLAALLRLRKAVLATEVATQLGDAHELVADCACFGYACLLPLLRLRRRGPFLFQAAVTLHQALLVIPDQGAWRNGNGAARRVFAALAYEVAVGGRQLLEDECAQHVLLDAGPSPDFAAAEGAQAARLIAGAAAKEEQEEADGMPSAEQLALKEFISTLPLYTRQASAEQIARAAGLSQAECARATSAAATPPPPPPAASGAVLDADAGADDAADADSRSAAAEPPLDVEATLWEVLNSNPHKAFDLVCETFGSHPRYLELVCRVCKFALARGMPLDTVAEWIERAAGPDRVAQLPLTRRVLAHGNAFGGADRAAAVAAAEDAAAAAEQDEHDDPEAEAAAKRAAEEAAAAAEAAAAEAAAAAAEEEAARLEAEALADPKGKKGKKPAAAAAAEEPEGPPPPTEEELAAAAAAEQAAREAAEDALLVPLNGALPDGKAKASAHAAAKAPAPRTTAAERTQLLAMAQLELLRSLPVYSALASRPQGFGEARAPRGDAGPATDLQWELAKYDGFGDAATKKTSTHAARRSSVILGTRVSQTVLAPAVLASREAAAAMLRSTGRAAELARWGRCFGVLQQAGKLAWNGLWGGWLSPKHFTSPAAWEQAAGKVAALAAAAEEAAAYAAQVAEDADAEPEAVTAAEDAAAAAAAASAASPAPLIPSSSLMACTSALLDMLGTTLREAGEAVKVPHENAGGGGNADEEEEEDDDDDDEEDPHATHRSAGFYQRAYKRAGIDAPFVASFVLFSAQVLCHTRAWPQLVAMVRRFNSLTGNGTAEATLPLLRHAQQQRVSDAEARRDFAAAALAKLERDWAEKLAWASKKRKTRKLVVNVEKSAEELRFERRQATRRGRLSRATSTLGRMMAVMTEVDRLDAALAAAKSGALEALHGSRHLLLDYLRHRELVALRSAGGAVSQLTQGGAFGGGGGGNADEAEVLVLEGGVVDSFRNTVAILRQRRATALLVQALHDLGNFQFARGGGADSDDAAATSAIPYREDAVTAWRDCVDSAFSTVDALHHWRSLDAFGVASDGVGGPWEGAAAKPTRELGARCCLDVGVVLSKLAKHGCADKLEDRLEACRMGARLLGAAAFGSALPHPTRASQFASYAAWELWPDEDLLSDPARVGGAGLLEALRFTAETLVRGGEAAAALPMCAAYEALASQRMLLTRETVDARLLRVEALLSLGMPGAAVTALGSVLVGSDLANAISAPQDTTRCGVTVVASKSSEALQALYCSYAEWVPPHHRANRAALKWLASFEKAALSPDLETVYGAALACRFSVLRARALLVLATARPLAAADCFVGEDDADADAEAEAEAEAADAGAAEDGAPAIPSMPRDVDALYVYLRARGEALLQSLCAEADSAPSVAAAAAADAEQGGEALVTARSMTPGLIARLRCDCLLMRAESALSEGRFSLARQLVLRCSLSLGAAAQQPTATSAEAEAAFDEYGVPALTAPPSGADQDASAAAAADDSDAGSIALQPTALDWLRCRLLLARCDALQGRYTEALAQCSAGMKEASDVGEFGVLARLLKIEAVKALLFRGAASEAAELAEALAGAGVQAGLEGSGEDDRAGEAEVATGAPSADATEAQATALLLLSGAKRQLALAATDQAAARSLLSAALDAATRARMVLDRLLRGMGWVGTGRGAGNGAEACSVGGGEAGAGLNVEPGTGLGGGGEGGTRPLDARSNLILRGTTALTLAHWVRGRALLELGARAEGAAQEASTTSAVAAFDAGLRTLAHSCSPPPTLRAALLLGAGRARRLSLRPALLQFEAGTVVTEGDAAAETAGRIADTHPVQRAADALTGALVATLGRGGGHDRALVRAACMELAALHQLQLVAGREEEHASEAAFWMTQAARALKMQRTLSVSWRCFLRCPLQPHTARSDLQFALAHHQICPASPAPMLSHRRTCASSPNTRSQRATAMPSTRCRHCRLVSSVTWRRLAGRDPRTCRIR